MLGKRGGSLALCVYSLLYARALGFQLFKARFSPLVALKNILTHSLVAAYIGFDVRKAVQRG